MYTYQDFIKAGSIKEGVRAAVSSHRQGDLYRTAIVADEYDRQRNTTISSIVNTIYTTSGEKVADTFGSDNRIACNYFNRLNTQRMTYSLGNGVSFCQPGEGGEDTVKERLGRTFDHDLMEWGYHALIHGTCFGFWNVDRLHVFKVTEFAPLYDEDTGILKAGVRFWQLDRTRPMTYVLYEEDGYTVFRDGTGGIEEVEGKRAYVEHYSETDAGGVVVEYGENYSALPIIPMHGSRLKQSTLVGMREAIDAYDIIRSGFANTVQDCASIYWLVENSGGMTDKDLTRFRDKLLSMHIANIDSDGGSRVTPYTMEVPTNASKTLLDELRAGIYEAFGALDVHTVSAGATNDHIDAAYQPMDENADDFEHQVSVAVIQLLQLMGIDDEPVFKRNRISNEKEQVEMVMQEAPFLDRMTILRKLPNIAVEEIQAIMDASDSEAIDRLMGVEDEEGAPLP